MAGIKLNARDMIIEISSGGITPTWVEIGGLTSFKYDPSEDEEIADTTTFKSKGRAEHEKMQTGAKAEIEGFRIADSVTGAQEPGQALAESLAELLGPESQIPFRFRHELDEEWKVWKAVITVGEQGGENNDKTGWKATLLRSGASTTVDVTP